LHCFFYKSQVLNKKKCLYNVALLNARESADVADQYYWSATIGNSRRNARGLKSDGRTARLPGQQKLAAIFAGIKRVKKERNW